MMLQNTKCLIIPATKKEQKKKDVFEEKERIDDSERGREHRYNHPHAKNLRLRMEKGGHPYYEHIRAGKISMQKISACLALFSWADYRYRDCGCRSRCDLLSQ